MFQEVYNMKENKVYRSLASKRLAEVYYILLTVKWNNINSRPEWQKNESMKKAYSHVLLVLPDDTAGAQNIMITCVEKALRSLNKDRTDSEETRAGQFLMRIKLKLVNIFLPFLTDMPSGDRIGHPVGIRDSCNTTNKMKN
ncbi:hypothetical protein KIN20_037405 [Parelaphostrongylus tenuis]|uniref:Uncharacterized protein n=1 Tax=Parelaphostrongylus tenuis TaxID=148309 RepID=A0AAD5REK0_PARTN|nr:hypothetical protein KIN20_037405 [Parelaphostrongylus tenuis]